jgi:hypothetical protein
MGVRIQQIEMKCLENKLAALCAVLLLAAGQGWAETALWSDNFETNTASHWTTGSIWKIGAPTAGPAKTHSGTQCAATGLTANVPANADAWFICTNYDGASTLTIPATNQFPRLRFSQWFDYVNAEGYVGIKESGSTSWQTISVTNLGFGNTPNYSSGVWSRPSIDLSAFAGTRVQIAFHFISLTTLPWSPTLRSSITRKALRATSMTGRWIPGLGKSASRRAAPMPPTAAAPTAPGRCWRAIMAGMWIRG